MSKITKNQGRFMASQIGEELMLMDANTGAFHSISGTGLETWNLLDSIDDLESIIAELAKRYEVTLADCRKDVLAFINRLADAGFVSRS